MVTSGLRPYQVDALDAIEAALARGQRRMAVVMAPGTGKSRVMAHTITRLLTSGQVRLPVYVASTRLQVDQMMHSMRSLDLGDGQLLEHQFVVHHLTANRPPEAGAIHLATTKRWQTLVREGLMPFDLVVLDDVTPGIARSTLSGTSADEAGPIVIGFSSSARRLQDDSAYEYSFGQAIADGALIAPPTAGMVDTSGGWPSFHSADPVHAQRLVTLIYHPNDRQHCERVGTELSSAGVRFAMTSNPAPSGLAPGDAYVPLLSTSLLNLPVDFEDASSSLERRGIDVIPAMAQYCAVPSWLAERVVVDVATSSEGLMRRLQATAQIGFDRLTPSAFEDLVEDLLRKLGFHLTPIAGDFGLDPFATFQDRERFGQPTSYFIHAKQYRSPLHDVTRLIGRVRRGFASRGLIVTTSWLTSVAEERLATAKRNGVHIEVIDGVRLRSFVLRHPDLLNKYFAGVK